MPATSGAIRAGRAFVELFADDRPLQRGLHRAARSLSAFGQSVRRLGAGLVGIGSAGLAGFLPALRAASDAQETFNRFAAVFQDQAAAADEFARRLASAVGRSQTEIQDALSSLQGFFVGLGFDRSRSRELSQTLEALALDFASFNNLSDDEAVSRFLSALSGSSEVLDKFGINIKAAAIEAELLRQGIDKTTAQATEQEKALARLQIIFRALTDQGAVGDALKTQGSFANQLKRLRAEVHDTQIALGQALLPVVTDFVTQAGRVLPVLREWAAAHQELVTGALQLFAGVTAAGGALVVFGVTIAAIGPALRFLALTMKFLFTATNKWVLALKLGLVALSGIALLRIPDVRQKLEDLGHALLKQAGLEELFDQLDQALELPELPADLELQLPDLAGLLAQVTGAAHQLKQQAQAGFERLAQFEVGTLRGRDLIRDALGIGRARQDPQLQALSAIQANTAKAVTHARTTAEALQGGTILVAGGAA